MDAKKPPYNFTGHQALIDSVRDIRKNRDDAATKKERTAHDKDLTIVLSAMHRAGIYYNEAFKPEETT